ncbi:MAG TPA: hypothetical protein VKT32_10635 [Chthonomonadaceae bacterium]|nr:hypothetical protein [Chthonomonadaceae bacterium]
MARQADFTAHIGLRGTPTLLNGQTLNALWEPAQLGRAQMFLAQELWGKPYFEVKFPATVLAAPYSLQAGNNVTWIARGSLGVIRQVIPEESDGEVVQVTCLVEFIPL